jgi:hypothetical protein
MTNNDWYVFLNDGKSLNLFKPTGEFNTANKPKMEHFTYKYDKPGINSDRKFLLGKLDSFDMFNPKTGNVVKNTCNINEKKFFENAYGVVHNTGVSKAAIIEKTKLNFNVLLTTLKTARKQSLTLAA